MGKEVFSRAGTVRSAVRPGDASDGLGQNGDTATQDIKPIQEEPEEKEEREAVEEEEETEVKVRRAPKGPTKREKEEHEATHIPYRDWCRHCVKGRAPNRPHRVGAKQGDQDDKERQVPRIAMDYFFLAREGERASEFPMLVMVDEETGNKYMRAVGRKGLGEGKEMEWLIKDMSEELKAWGHPGGQGTELILKSDGEPSIKAVRDALARYHGGRITPEVPPPGESQANGRAEEAGKTVRGYVRVFKDAIEYKTNTKIPTDAAILQWLVRWAAMVVSRFRVGEDGKTPYQRQKGRKCKEEVVPFAELVHYRKLSEDPGRNKLESPWEEGLWLGHARSSNEALIGTENGVVRAWAVKRRQEEERWDAKRILEMQGTPARPNPQSPGVDVPVHIHLPQESEVPLPGEPPPARVETAPRRTYLKARDFEKHGYTEGCEGCRRLRTGGMGARPHTETCRNRMEERLKEEDDPRWRRAKEKLDEAVWEEVQRQDPEAAAETARMRGDTREGAAAPAEAQEEHRTEEEEEKQEEKDEEPDEEEEMEEGEEKQQQEEGEAAKRGAEEEAESRKRMKRGPEQGNKRKGREEGGENASEEETGPSVRRRIEDAQALRRATQRRQNDGQLVDLTYEEGALEEGHNPLVVVAAPHRTGASPLNRMRALGKPERGGESGVMDRGRVDALLAVYKQQCQRGDFFVHAVPEGAPAWAYRPVEEALKEYQLYVVVGDQCCFDVVKEERGRAGGVKRGRMKYLTNSWHIAAKIEVRCDGKHRHVRAVHCRGDPGRGRFTAAWRRAVYAAAMKERKMREQKLSAVAEVRSQGEGLRTDPMEFHDDLEAQIKQLGMTEKEGAWDDVTGMPLDRAAVQAARREEIEYVRSKNVWTKVPRAEAARQGMKVVKTRWIDINKGDDEKPVYRSRFVAKEFNDSEIQGLFAGTPPLEAMRYILHMAATSRRGRNVVMINDVSRAFFEAVAKRKVCIELPEEDLKQNERNQDLVGALNMSLYGTRDAAKNWQDEVARMMKIWGFRQGRYNPCLFHHEKWRLVTLVHGDDFVSVGEMAGMQEFRKALENRFKMKTQLVGSGGGEEVTEARVLNRIIRVTQDGWEYEPDQRHVDLIVEGLSLGAAKGVSTPGEEERPWEAEENATELENGDVRRFRGMAARLNYLAADRPDIAYAVKEVCRGMARPRRGDWKRLKRVARYLVTAKRTVTKYPWQDEEWEVDTYTDSDWAGCRVTGKSTSGGVVMIGAHLIKSWATTQASIALSSAEAELVAMTKATAETIGIIHMVRDLGAEISGVVYADSSAALAIADRRGSGKLRHICIRKLWLQEKEQRGEVELRKVKGQHNPADLLTKYMSSARMEELMRRIGQTKEAGRARTALDIQGGVQLESR